MTDHLAIEDHPRTRGCASRARKYVDIIIESSIENPERIERRREQIIEAAVRCFAADGYHRATIKDIADAAGFSSGLIYSYVKDKEDVLFLVFTSIFRTYQRAIPPRLEGVTDPLLRFCIAVRAYCEAVDGNLGATVVGYRESASLRPELRKAIQKMELETNKLVSDPIEECIKAGYFRPVNVDLLTFRLVFFAHGWALKHWHFAKVISLDGYIEEGLNSFLNDLLTASGRKHWQSLVDSGAAVAATRPARPARSARKRSAAKGATKRKRSV
ncbi:MAG: TetR/AcrR family transcriptional regulator [Burkholderiaceae bacterium]|nr:TetR/AcrR family transcriptional regulator [Burkholderiaceae bacterium]